MSRFLSHKWTIGILFAIVFIGFMYLQQPHSTTVQDPQTMTDLSISALENDIEEGPEVQGVEEEQYVDIKGQVNHPGVYNLKPNMRMKDVIDLAGGFSANAAERAINLAQKVNDGEMIYVPSIEEYVEEATKMKEPENNRISINAGTKEDLMQLPNIGPKKADAIILYREENGHFTTIEELKNVNGIGEKTFDQLKEFIHL